jgi:hypothetical protein
MTIGFFSLSLQALGAQLDSLFEGAGGKDSLALLDELTKLNEAERHTLLRAFLSVAKEFSETRATWEEENDDETVEADDIFDTGCNKTPSASKNNINKKEQWESKVASKLCDEILCELNPGFTRKTRLQVVTGGKIRSKIVQLHRSFTPPTPPMKPVA